MRRFQRWSEDQAQAAPALPTFSTSCWWPSKGIRTAQPPTVGDLAGYLLLRPHSAAELADRAEAAGLVGRIADPDDGRVVRVGLTAEGNLVLQKLTRAHLDQLHDLAAVLNEFVTSRDDERDS